MNKIDITTNFTLTTTKTIISEYLSSHNIKYIFTTNETYFDKNYNSKLVQIFETSCKTGFNIDLFHQFLNWIDFSYIDRQIASEVNLPSESVSFGYKHKVNLFDSKPKTPFDDKNYDNKTPFYDKSCDSKTLFENKSCDKKCDSKTPFDDKRCEHKIYKLNRICMWKIIPPLSEQCVFLIRKTFQGNDPSNIVLDGVVACGSFVEYSSVYLGPIDGEFFSVTINSIERYRSTSKIANFFEDAGISVHLNNPVKVPKQVLNSKS